MKRSAYFDTLAFSMRLLRAGFNDLANAMFRLAWALKPRIAGEVECPALHEYLMDGYACPLCKAAV